MFKKSLPFLAILSLIIATAEGNIKMSLLGMVAFGIIVFLMCCTEEGTKANSYIRQMRKYLKYRRKKVTKKIIGMLQESLEAEEGGRNHA